MSAILVVGSVGYDTITTPKGQRENILGGSANYFSLAASIYSPVRVVGVVGQDYKPEHRGWLEQRKVDLRGLQQVPGLTFHWEGKYENDMNEAITLVTDLNVFENFHPAIPPEYKNSEVVFLANIDPVLQLQVLEQVQKPRLIAADTMNYWIQSKKKDLFKVLERIDVLLINENELRQLTDSWNTIRAAKDVIKMGPKAVVIKRGEYGFVMFCEDRFFILPAFPVEEVVDPTGAGDTFAGGFLGHLAQIDRPWNREDLKQACVHGCLLASFTVQDFGVEGIRRATMKDLEERLEAYRKVIS
ncbi:MAG TPA: PfkB family carbohydrate kinase [Bdellovibrionales bacterium]|nr:PfkB family carbohydrate kinase [Bdellovibrionales bacterium]